MKKIAVLFIVVLLLSFNLGSVFAQSTNPETTPAPQNTPTPEPEREPSSGQKGPQFFFSQEVLDNTVPLEFQDKLPKGSGAKFEGEAAKHIQELSLPKEVTDEIKTEPTPEPKQNIFQAILSWLQNLLGVVFLGDKGYVKSFVPPQAPRNSSQPTNNEQEVMFDNLDQAANYVEQTLYPEEFNADRFLANFDPSAFNIQSGSLQTLFQETAQGQCVPLGMLLAISHREFDGTFNLSDEDFQRLSSNDWKGGLPLNHPDMVKTACKNTCANPGAGCNSTDDVQGPMQFNWGTWLEHVDGIKTVLHNKYGIEKGTYEPHRCNVRDAIIGAALKMKGVPKSESSCTNWGRDTVYRVAENYCGYGACSGARACGQNYCGEVWNMYNNYSTPETM